MPTRARISKTLTSLSIDDVMGAPVATVESKPTKQVQEEPPVVPAVQNPPYVPPVTSSPFVASSSPASTSRLRNAPDPSTEPAPTHASGSKFIPGMISAAPHVPAHTGSYRTYTPTDRYSNGSDRYSNGPTKTVSGYLDIMSEGHGFLRPKFVQGEGDVYISQSQIRKFALREGDMVEGQARLPKDNERYLGLLKVEKVNAADAAQSQNRPVFESLTPIYPNKQLILETGKAPISTRMIDLLSPIGFGQRGLVVSPPKAGKTTILKEIAHGITANFPDVHLMAVLIGERPEEVTDIARSVKGEVIASNFDEAPEAQTKIAEIALERAKRMLEMGKQVVILLDSITRLARAYNLSVNPSGRTLSGGFDPAALYPAKKFLGAARNCEEKGSLTILGTALVETGSRMDDLIYEEFKGTGNMELHLSRFLQEQRVFPAIDIERSGTRHEELLLSPENLKKIVTLRHMLSLLGDSAERTTTLIERLSKSASNSQFLETLTKG